MIKNIIEAQNYNFKGHEQSSKRPYLIVYDSSDYILGFPTTTKQKIKKSYPSHKNPIINTREARSEVMIDQLQLIYKKYFINSTKFLIQDFEYKSVIESFINQIIGDKNIEGNGNCPSFYDIIYFTHNIPEFSNIDKWLVVSSKHFNAYTGMCFIIPMTSLNLAYIHSIDWKVRQVNIIDKKIYTANYIQTLKESIKNLLM